MNLNTLSSYYLAHIIAASLFRTVTYIFMPTRVAKVKLSKRTWEDNAEAREISYIWIHTIRIFMGFRTVCCFVIAYLTWGFVPVEEERSPLSEGDLLVTKLQYWFCVINFLLDCYLLQGLYGHYAVKQRYDRNPEDPVLKKSALIHQAPGTPLFIQSILFVPGVVYMIWTTFFM